MFLFTAKGISFFGTEKPTLRAGSEDSDKKKILTGPEENELPFLNTRVMSSLFFKIEDLFKTNTLKRNRVVG